MTFYGVKKECRHILTLRLKVNTCMQVTLHFNAGVFGSMHVFSSLHFNACIFSLMHVFNSSLAYLIQFNACTVYSMQCMYDVVGYREYRLQNFVFIEGL